MKKWIYIMTLLLMTIHMQGQADLPQVESGRIERYESFKSAYVNPHTIDVWLPDGYTHHNKYAVLYMHDGQMLFDSTTTWNHKEWMLDEVVGQLIKEKRIKDCIVVGIHNKGEFRHSEYYPQKPFESLPDTIQSALLEKLMHNRIQSDNYLRFIVNEVKPMIDKTYPTMKDQAHTMIAGSSMGGLISMYAICEYPEVFGGAACISTHWIGAFGDWADVIGHSFIDYLKLQLPSPKNHKIYFDYGTIGLDAYYKPYQDQVDEVMKQKGFTHKNWLTKDYKGKDHSEDDWAERLDIPLLFLLGR